MTTLQLTVAELDHRVRAWIPRLEGDAVVTPDEYLEIGRLWNTITAHASLSSDPDRAHFLDLVTAVMPKMAVVLNMAAGRGYALSSSAHDFVLGGLLEKRHQYEVADLNASDRPPD